VSTAISTAVEGSNDNICDCDCDCDCNVTEGEAEGGEEAEYEVGGYFTTLVVIYETSALGAMFKPRSVHLGYWPTRTSGGEFTGTISTAITLDTLCAGLAVFTILSEIKSECCSSSQDPDARKDMFCNVRRTSE
jgi:hypothetical protein